jgi:hypothetical protein
MSINYRIERWNRPYRPNPAMLLLELSRDGYNVSQCFERPGTDFGSRKLAEDYSRWIISGTLELRVDQVGMFRLNPGDRDHLPAETRHSARVIGDEPVIYLIGIRKRQKPKRKRGRPKKVVEDDSWPPPELRNLLALMELAQPESESEPDK